MKKIIFISALTFLFLLLIPVSVSAYEKGDIVDITPILEESLSGIDLSAWEEYISGNKLFSEITNNLSVTEFIDRLIRGEAVISFESFLSTAFSDFIHSLKSHMTLAGILFGLALSSAIITRTANGIFKGNISSVASNILFFASIGFSITGFADIVSTAADAITDMSELWNKTLPILMIFSSASASSASTVLQPGTLMVSTLTTKLISAVIIPLLAASALLSIAYNISKRNPFSEISSSLKNLTDWLIGIMFTLFFGFISIQRITAGALDNASIKTIKYTLSSFSLYGGSYLSKSFDIVTGCAMIMKNVIGGIGMIILLTVCISPALELIAVSVVYRMTAVLISFTGEDRISGLLRDVGKIYGTLFLSVMTASILFFTMMSAICAVGSV